MNYYKFTDFYQMNEDIKEIGESFMKRVECFSQESMNMLEYA